MTECGRLGNSDFGGLISVHEELEEQLTVEKNGWGATRVSLEPTLKCDACDSRVFAIDYCSKIFADTPMANNEVVSFVRKNLKDLSCSQCGEKKVQLVWTGQAR